jgi:hypothetical protein
MRMVNPQWDEKVAKVQCRLLRGFGGNYRWANESRTGRA